MTTGEASEEQATRGRGDRFFMTPLREDPRRRLLKRHPDNPLLTAFDWPYFVNTVFNPGAVRLASGEIQSRAPSRIYTSRVQATRRETKA